MCQPMTFKAENADWCWYSPANANQKQPSQICQKWMIAVTNLKLMT